MLVSKSDILTLVSKDLKKSSSTKIKVSQREYFNDKLPKIYTQCLELDETIAELEKLGYICKLSKTDKVVITKGVEVFDKGTNSKHTKTVVSGSRKLITTNLIVSKK